MNSRRAQILAPTMENLRLAADALHRGEVVGMPTETVYGLAGDALNPAALARIFDTKERPTFDPLIVHVPISVLSARLMGLEKLGLVDLKAMSALARERAEKLIGRFWPGPLTLVLPKLPSVPDLATSGLPTVAIRMPRHSVAQALLATAGTPLAAPSANRFGRISPTRAEHVMEELGDRIDFILDGGPCDIGVESTVLAIHPQGELSLLRPGGISADEIESITGARPARGISGEAQASAIAPGASATIAQRAGITPDSTITPDAATYQRTNAAQSPTVVLGPGMLESHYAPEKPLFLLSHSVDQLLASVPSENPALSPSAPSAPAALSTSELSAREPAMASALQHHPRQLGFLLMSGDPATAKPRLEALTGHPCIVHSLSPKGDLAEAAKNLFHQLRALDHSSADVLLAEPCSSKQGLGHAIADRIQRAAAKRD